MLSLFLAGALFAADDFRLGRVQESLTATYRHYQQYIDGIPVIGVERVERKTHQGKTEVVYDTRVERPATSPADARPVAGRSTVYVIHHGVARLARRTITADAPLQPYATYLDEETGEVIRREPLFWRAAARVFDGNPVVRLNDPTLQDQNDAAAAVPAAVYTTVDLPDLAPATPLTGPNARIVDIETPFTTHADPSQPLLFDRSQPQFEEVNAYFHIDRVQRYLQSLGYTGARRLVAYAIPIDPHAAEGADSSYYIQGATPGEGTLYFGDGGTDDAEDSDLMVHEFGHAIEDWIAPGAFGGGNASESRALGEGFGDYWAFSARYATAIASGRDPSCLADWDARCANDDPSQNCSYPAGANCLRRVDGAKTMSDFLRTGGSGTEHKNGEIWSSALRQIFLSLIGRYGLSEGKRIADTIVIESHFGTPPNPAFRAMAEKMLDADGLLYGGANADAICSAMTQRGVLAACDRLPRGERTFFQSPQQGIAIPDADPAGIESQLVITDPRDASRVFVHVDIAHPARGDLKITLIAPDGTEVLLHDTSLDRTADIHGTYGLDLLPDQPLDVFIGRPAAGTWKLRVADVLTRDAGALLSWSLALQFSGDEPSPVRPESLTGSRFIAAVAHAPGANLSSWRSDVRLLNRGTSPATVTLIFTPSGEDGNARFGAVKLTIAPSQVVAFDDIVAQQFQTVGTGQIQITGETADVVANARTYTDASRGTYGQFTASTSAANAAGRGDAPLVVTQVRSNDAFRTNIGVAEVGGSAGTVRERLYDAETGALLQEDLHAIAPFSHRQDLVRGSDSMTAEIDVVDGNARVIAYGAVVDNRTADPIYVPAARPSTDPQIEVGPVISASGAFGTHWTSDLWLTGTSVMAIAFADARTGERLDRSFDAAAPHGSRRVEDVVSAAFHRPGSFGLLRVNVPAGSLVSSRISTPAAGGAFGQFVPFRSIDDPTVLVNGITTRRLMPIESSPSFRTNLGVANLGGLIARLRLVVHDSSGTSIGSLEIAVDPLQLIQIPIQRVIGDRPLRSGWANVELIEVSRGLLLYASVVDNASGDAVHIPAE